MHLVDAFGKQPEIEVTACHHEQAVGIAAEACGRVQGNFGVAIVTTGPGATNVITPVVGAWIESVPMLILSGQAKRSDLIKSSGLRQKGVQEVDIVTMVKGVTKYAKTIENPADILLELQKAIYLATSGRKGPVWLDVPLDVQGFPITEAELTSFENTVAKSSPKEEYAGTVLDYLRKAKRPVILAGNGIRLDNAADDFKSLVECLRIPVVTTWNALDLLPHSHPLNVGRPGVVALRAPNFTVQNSDLIISIGCRLDNVITAFNPKGFAREALKVVVDIDQKELDKLEMKVDCKINVGAAEFIYSLLTLSSQIGPLDIEEWRQRCQGWKKRYPTNDGKTFEKSQYLSHYEFCDKVSDYLPENTVICTGSSGLSIEIFYTVFRNKPGQRVFLTAGLGSMGYGLPAAIGACIANNKKPTILFEGDGSLQLNLQEFATIRAKQLPICIIVLNNGGYTSIRNTQRNYFDGRYVGTGLESGLWFPDLKKLTELYEMNYYSISKSEDIAEVINKAIGLKSACIVNVQLKPDEILAPKVSAIPQADGSMISMPLEDMSPLLSLEDLKGEMLIELVDQSKKAKR